MGEMVGTPRMIKLLNKDVIEGIIKVNGPVTKPEIARMTNLSLVTVNKTVDLLLRENRVKVSDVKDSSVGRRAQYFEINEELHYMIGLHYDRSSYIGAVSNSVGQIIYRQEYPLDTRSLETVMEHTFSALDSLAAFCEGHEIAAVGLGVPGVVKEGVVTDIPNIPCWEGMDVAGLLEERYSAAVFLENDINLAAMGVYYSQYRDKVDSLALVYLEQGIGSGFILNRELFKGATNFAGELGYLSVGLPWTVGVLPDTREARAVSGQPDTQETQAGAGQPDTRETQARAGQPDTRETQASIGQPDTRETQASIGQPDSKESRTIPSQLEDRHYKGGFEHTVMRLEEQLRQAGGSARKELKNQLRKAVAQGLLSIVCVINPQVLGLVCSHLSKADVKQIGELLKEYVGEEHTPRLIKLEDIKEQSIRGLMGMCMREISPTYSLSSRKRG